MSVKVKTNNSVFKQISGGIPKAPFIIGVCGNMDLTGYDDRYETCWQNEQMGRLKKKVFAILDWIRGRGAESGNGVLVPEEGLWDPTRQQKEHLTISNEKKYSGCWSGLNLKQTPMVLLTSLAPGADTVVAEAVLEYADLHNEIDILVRCPLPFPLDQYKKSSTFNSEEKRSRLESLLLKIRSQEGFKKEYEDRDIFEVQLDNDLSGEINEDLTSEDSNGRPRRHLRYRAAGEYVAAMSRLLLAVYDTEDAAAKNFNLRNLKNNLYECGTTFIIEAKRSGLSHELLAMGNNFSWADNGPVLVIPVQRQKSKTTAPSKSLFFLHPYDCKPMTGYSSKSSPTEISNFKKLEFFDSADNLWQQSGDQCFRRIIYRLEKFNQLEVIDQKKESVELKKLLGHQQKTWMEALVNPLDSLARIRRRSADKSNQLNRLRKQLLWRMWILIFITAFSLGSFEHWHNPSESSNSSKYSTTTSSPDHQEVAHMSSSNATVNSLQHLIDFDPPALIQNIWLIIALTGFLTSSWLYYCYLRDGNEECRYDYRAISEALRVQFYWIITGTGRNVSAEYMQRQRDELDWIRALVTSVSIPLESSRRFFMALPKECMVELFSLAHSQWVSNQAEYFKKTTVMIKRQAHSYHRKSWSLLAGGLISIIGLLIAHISPFIHEILEHNWVSISLFLICAGTLPLFVSAFFVVDHGKPEQNLSTDMPFVAWVFGDFVVWGSGIIIAGISMFSAFLVDFAANCLPVYHQACLPDAHNAWLIFTGATLLAGGLCLAWVERNFLNEEARVYSSIAFLYACADRRLGLLIEKFKMDEDTKDNTRLLKEIQDLFYQLGCESLNENAEWLIQHRARPLEMFVAG